MICHTVCRESNKRRYYIRGIGITPHFGLAGFGTGPPPSVVPAGKVLKD